MENLMQKSIRQISKKKYKENNTLGLFSFFYCIEKKKINKLSLWKSAASLILCFFVYL